MRRCVGMDHASRALRLLLAAAMLAVACGENSAFGLQVEHARWEDREPFAYQFNVRRSCFCDFDVLRRVTIEVAGGSVQRRYFADTGEDVPEHLVDAYPDIDAIFDELRRIADRQPHLLDIEYDAYYGFPATVFVDRVKRMADDEFQLEVTDFQLR